MSADIRLGARMLAKNPVSSLLIASLLAVGIGARTVMFSVFDAVLLRPLPVKNVERLVRMVQRRQKLTYSNFPYAYYRALKEHSNTFSDVFGETSGDAGYRVTMTAPGPATPVIVSGVTPGFFDGLGVRVVWPNSRRG